jgi:hypothetical protein
MLFRQIWHHFAQYACFPSIELGDDPSFEVTGNRLLSRGYGIREVLRGIGRGQEEGGQ